MFSNRYKVKKYKYSKKNKKFSFRAHHFVSYIFTGNLPSPANNFFFLSANAMKFGSIAYKTLTRQQKKKS